MYVAGRNLGVIMRRLFGIGKPKCLQTEGADGFARIWAAIGPLIQLIREIEAIVAIDIDSLRNRPSGIANFQNRIARREIAAAA
jgi:hypothetical protein